LKRRRVRARGPDGRVTNADGAAGLVVKGAGGYRYYASELAPYDATVNQRVDEVGGLLHIATDYEVLGHDEVCEPIDTPDPDGPTEDCMHPTIITDVVYQDWLIDPADGQVVWAASCNSGPDDGNTTPVTPVVSASGDTFSYAPCVVGKSAPLRFTRAQVRGCARR